MYVVPWPMGGRGVCKGRTREKAFSSPLLLARTNYWKDCLVGWIFSRGEGLSLLEAFANYFLFLASILLSHGKEREKKKIPFQTVFNHRICAYYCSFSERAQSELPGCQGLRRKPPNS